MPLKAGVCKNQRSVLIWPIAKEAGGRILCKRRAGEEMEQKDLVEADAGATSQEFYTTQLPLFFRCDSIS